MLSLVGRSHPVLSVPGGGAHLDRLELGDGGGAGAEAAPLQPPEQDRVEGAEGGRGRGRARKPHPCI